MNLRVKTFALVVSLMFVILLISMYILQVVDGGDYVAAAETAKVRTIATRGYRGRILDRYGRTIATNKAAYEIVLNMSEIDNQQLNPSITGALAAMEACGAEKKFSLPIVSTEDGLQFKCTGSGAEFLTGHGLDISAPANQAFAGLRSIYNIPIGMPDTDAAKVIALYAASERHEPAYSAMNREKYSALVNISGSIGQPFEFDSAKRSVWPIADVARLSPDALLLISKRCENAAGSIPAMESFPIYVGDDGSMSWYTGDIRKLKKDTGLERSATAHDCVLKLMETYKAGNVPSEYLLDLLAIRLEATRSGFRAYTPLTIGVGQDSSVATLISENALSLTGVSVEQSYVRHYPYGELLSSTLGYTGKITAEMEDEYKEHGYDLSSDIVGRDGLESELEQYLRPMSGSKTVTIDRTGRMVDLLEETPARNGSDVLLTIDLDLQMVAEESLADTMAKIRSGDMGEAYSQANVGAAVAIDVNSGEVLAMASQPGYDVNLFSSTVDDEVWKQLNPTYTIAGDETKPDNDPTLPRPMVNNAVSGAYPPGSTYKTVTAVAGLMEGVITVGEQIEDKGRYTRFSQTQAPACWTWNDSHTTHGLVDMHSAISGSCNYYFYELGYRLGNKRIEEYARRFGLGQETGIELPNEAQGMIGGETAVQNVLKRRAADMVKSYAPDRDTESIDNAVATLVDDFSMKNTQELLARFGLNTTQMTNVYDYINDNRWRESRVLSSAVGQGDNNYSVLQMANMTAAISMGGLRYRPALLKGVPSAGIYNSPEVVSEAFMSSMATASVKDGMYAVVNEQGGTARRHFEGCNIQVAGKTGSAQFEGRDAYAWFISFAPVDNPSIAVAVMIGRGGKGSYAAPVARAIIEEYFKAGDGTHVEQGGDMF